MLDHSINASTKSPTNTTSSTVVSSPDSFVPHDLPQVPVSSASNTPFPFDPNQPLGQLSLNSIHNIIETYNLDTVSILLMTASHPITYIIDIFPAPDTSVEHPPYHISEASSLSHIRLQVRYIGQSCWC